MHCDWHPILTISILGGRNIHRQILATWRQFYKIGLSGTAQELPEALFDRTAFTVKPLGTLFSNPCLRGYFFLPLQVTFSDLPQRRPCSWVTPFECRSRSFYYPSCSHLFAKLVRTFTDADNSIAFTRKLNFTHNREHLSDDDSDLFASIDLLATEVAGYSDSG